MLVSGRLSREEELWWPFFITWQNINNWFRTYQICAFDSFPTNYCQISARGLRCLKFWIRNWSFLFITDVNSKIDCTFFILFNKISSYDNNINSWKFDKLLSAGFEDIWEFPMLTHLLSTHSVLKTGNTGNIYGSVPQNWIWKCYVLWTSR